MGHPKDLKAGVDRFQCKEVVTSLFKLAAFGTKELFTGDYKFVLLITTCPRNLSTTFLKDPKAEN